MRLIDADAIVETLKEARKKADSPRRDLDLLILQEMIQLAPTIAPPPNDPLTLEELREMDGEPIYIPKVGWRICYGVDETGSIATVKVGRTTRMYDYGKTWLAYRRKTEEVTV